MYGCGVIEKECIQKKWGCPEWQPHFLDLFINDRHVDFGGFEQVIEYIFAGRGERRTKCRIGAKQFIESGFIGVCRHIDSVVVFQVHRAIDIVQTDACQFVLVFTA